MQERFSTQIIVKELRPIKTGSTKDGTPYTISQVIATKPDGVPINQFNLRTFDDLPTNSVIDVDCELFRSERFGDSYTVKLKAGQATGRDQDIADLRTRVERIENFLSGRGEWRGAAADAGPPPPPSGGDAPPRAPDLPPGGDFNF